MTDDSPQDDAAAVTAEEDLEAREAEAEVTGPAPADDAKPELDDVKKRFREALDRKKQANSADAAASAGKGKGKAQGAHGPASTRRSFRRKSG